MHKNKTMLLVGILATHLLLLIIFKFTAWPEMTLWPYLMSQGWMPYRDIAIAHTPMMLIDLAVVYKIFGVGIMQLKIFTWGLILLSDVLVFFVVKKLWNIKTAFVTLIVYVLWLMFYDGNGLWFDLYMGILAFCSYYFAKNKKWFWTGTFWSLAFISKQTAVWFLIPIALEMLNGKWLMVKNILRRPCMVTPFKVIARFVVGVLTIAVPFTILLFTLGILPDFWNWAVKFGTFVLPTAQGQIQLPDVKTLAVAVFPFFIFVPLIFKNKSSAISLLLWAVAGSLGALPRFEYFHFQPAVFYLAIAGALVFTEKKNLISKIFIPVYLLGSSYLMFTYFVKNFNQETRFYENNVKEIVDSVKYSTQKGDRIFVLNYWDNIYALTETQPSIWLWVPQLSWYMDIPGIQEKIVDDLKNNSPKLIVYNPYTKSGLSSYIPEKVYDYIMNNYKVSQSMGDIKILIQN